jgi:hypothetical protein
VKLRYLLSGTCLCAAVLSFTAAAGADECSANKSIDWTKTLASNPKTADLVYVAGVNTVAAGQAGATTIALIPLSLSGSFGVQSLLIYRLTTRQPCAPPELLGSFKTATTLVRSYFANGTLHLITLADQKESSSRHPNDFLDTGYHFKDGKLVKVSSKETKAP